MLGDSAAAAAQMPVRPASLSPAQVQRAGYKLGSVGDRVKQTAGTHTKRAAKDHMLLDRQAKRQPAKCALLPLWYHSCDSLGGASNRSMNWDYVTALLQQHTCPSTSCSFTCTNRKSAQAVELLWLLQPLCQCQRAANAVSLIGLSVYQR